MFSDNWDSVKRQVEKALKSRTEMTEEAIEELRDKIKEGDVITFELQQRVDNIEGDQGELEQMIEDWLLTHEVIEEINDPDMYESDLFGNPTRK